MSEPIRDTTCLLHRLQAGDESACMELIDHACERLRRLSSLMLREYPVLWELTQTDDVLNSAVIRLLKALKKERPENGRHFFNIAAQHIRWELNDLVRRYRGRDGKRPRQLTNRDGTSDEEALYGGFTDGAEDLAILAAWGDFHDQAGLLPEKEREVFGMLYYGGLSQQDAAIALNVSLNTVKRRWNSAQRKLGKALGGEMPW